jgi:hypothetical protein
MTFDEMAPGVCAFAAQYPDEAPAAIEYLGSTYVQSGRFAVPATPPGRQVATSGDWTVYLSTPHLELITRNARFEYRPSNC